MGAGAAGAWRKAHQPPRRLAGSQRRTERRDGGGVGELPMISFDELDSHTGLLRWEGFEARPSAAEFAALPLELMDVMSTSPLILSFKCHRHECHCLKPQVRALAALTTITTFAQSMTPC